MRIVLFLGITVSLLLGRPGSTFAQDEARAIIAKGIKALGGEEKIDQVKAWRSKSQGTLTGGAGKFTQVAFVQLPQKFKEVFHLEDRKQTITTVWTGDDGWIDVNGSINPLAGATLAGIKETLYFTEINRLTPLTDKKYNLTLWDEVQVDGRPAVGVKIAAKGHQDVQLYFDKENGLPVKTTRMIIEAPTQKFVLEERLYSGYATVAGRQWPKKVVVNRTGKKYMELEVVEIEVLDKVDPGVFIKPVPARPQEPKKPYPYLAEEVAYENKAAGVKFAGTLTLPRSGGPFPAVLLGAAGPRRNHFRPPSLPDPGRFPDAPGHRRPARGRPRRGRLHGE